MMRDRVWRRVLLMTFICASAAACKDERPPAPAPKAEAAGVQAASFTLGEDAAVLTFAEPGGTFADRKTLEDVPENVRGFVRVTVLGGEKPPAGHVWVANLQGAAAGSEVTLQAVARAEFEELALGQGLASEFALPPGLEPPEQTGSVPGQVVVYKTAWCGVCKKVESYLKRKGVEYVAKDIEKDREAAAELQAKATDAGIQTGSVPVIDVGGTLIVGFDRNRLEKLLAQ